VSLLPGVSMWNIEIENIAGIREGSAQIVPGINAIQASNWRGKTSLVTATRTVLGGDVSQTVLTEGESSGCVTLTEQTGEEHTVRFERENGIVQQGSPYLTDEQDRVCAELFAFLDETNEIRATVRDSADLTQPLTRPLEEENIEREIAERRRERRTLRTQLEEAQHASRELTETTERITELELDCTTLREELADLSGSDGEQDTPSDRRAKLNETRKRREQVQRTVNRLVSKVESLESQINEKETRLADLDVPTAPDEELSEKVDEKRETLRQLEDETDVLQTLYNANKRILDRDCVDLVDIERQIDTDQIDCWVCGNNTTRCDIEQILGNLNETICTRKHDIADLRSTVEGLDEQRREIEQKRRQREEIERELSRLQTEHEESRDDLITNRDHIEEIDAEINELEGQVQDIDDRRSALEGEIAQKEANLDALCDTRDSLVEKADQRDDLEAAIEVINADIESLRSHREGTIDQAREAFEDALADVVRQFSPSFESARLEKHTDTEGKTEKLELVIAREGREIPVDALSEGEVELVGFVAALAGYNAFDVYERVPCILLDGIGALASEHLHTLVSYLKAQTTYLVTSAYPEAGTFDGHAISPETWTVVSD
jgi:DNA repair exonuclease SbcCD ATPase subunit